MATYKGIQGYSVQNLSSDPSDLAVTEGELWYNSGQGKFKVAIPVAGAWAAGGNMNSARYRWGGGMGTVSAGTVAGGVYTPGYTASGLVEDYDGTSWTVATALPGADADSACTGTQTAGLLVGGRSSAPAGDRDWTLGWNGSAWTEIGTYPIVSSRTGVTGTQTAAIAAGGFDVLGAPPDYLIEVNTFNGASWTAGADYPTNKRNLGMAGTTTATLAFGGASTDCNTYNGTSWAAVNSMNTPRSEFGYSVSGTQTAAMAFGGGDAPPPANLGDAEIWNGTSWTEVANLTRPRAAMATIGTSSTLIGCGGSPVSPGVDTEEWTGPYAAAKVVTVS